MTLVVARANSAGLLLVSDTRVTFVSPEGTRAAVPTLAAHPLDGVLKLVVLNDSQCVGFAGDVQVAQLALEAIVADGLCLRANDETILERLLAAHTGSGGSTDFVLGSVVRGPRIHEVKDGVIRRDVGATWLGSANAFAEYQRLYLAGPGPVREPPPGQALTRMSEAMHRLVEGAQSFNDVGDFVIRVTARRHGLVYLPYAIASFPPSSTTSTEGTRLDMGSAATGAYSYAVLCPTDAGSAIVAVYFAHGGFGTVFAPLVAREPKLIAADSAESFVALVEGATGKKFRGTVILSDRVVTLGPHDPGTSPSGS